MKKFSYLIILSMVIVGCKTTQVEHIKPEPLPPSIDRAELENNAKEYEEFLRQEVKLAYDQILEIREKSESPEITNSLNELVGNLENVISTLGTPHTSVKVDDYESAIKLHENLRLARERGKKLEEDYVKLLVGREKLLKDYEVKYGKICGELNELRNENADLLVELGKYKESNTLFGKVALIFKIILPIAGIIAVIYIKMSYGKIAAGVAAIGMIAITVTYFVFKYMEEIIVAGGVFIACLLLAALAYLVKEKWVNKDIVYSVNKSAEGLESGEKKNFFEIMSGKMGWLAKSTVNNVKKVDELEDVSNV